MAPEEWKQSYNNIVHCSPALCLPHFYVFSRQFYMFLAVPSRLVPYSISFWCRRALRSPSRHAMQSVNTLKIIIYNVSEKDTKTLFRANLPFFSGQKMNFIFFWPKKSCYGHERVTICPEKSRSLQNEVICTTRCVSDQNELFYTKFASTEINWHQNEVAPLEHCDWRSVANLFRQPIANMH